MRLIVNIDDETYNDIKKGKIYSSFRDVPLESVNAIANGTPLSQEPCDDCISRQDAVNACRNGWGYDDETIKHIVGNILELPPVTPQQKTGHWIPVSEGLPEIKQHVLLSCYGRVIYGRMISEDGNSGYPVFEICDSVGEKRPIVLETTVHSEYTTSRIKAWMPLPEPYKETQ
jgi:hypothetical protein